MASYIPDGWEREGYIEGTTPNDAGERLYDPLEFTYRAAARMEVIRLDGLIEAAMNRTNDPDSAVKAEMIACNWVAGRIKAWSLKAAGIHDVAATADSCSRMNATLFRRLYMILRGSEMSDPKPPETNPPPIDEDQMGN